MEMFKKGDKFIHFTKYGGVNKGEVAEIQGVTNWDKTNLCTYVIYRIFTNNGFSLNLDGTDGRIYKIESEMTPKGAGQIKETYRRLVDSKVRETLSSITIHNTNEDKKT